MFGLKEVAATSSIEDVLAMKSILKKDIHNIGVNPRMELNQEVIKTLKDIDEIEPLKLGYCAKDSLIEFDGVSLAGKVFLIDGEHRYHSRAEDATLPCTIKEYTDSIDILRDSVVYNLHGQRLKNEEIYKIINKEIDIYFIKEKNNLKKLPQIRHLAKTYKIDKDTAGAIVYENVLKKKIPNAEEFDCLMAGGQFRKYIISGIKDLIKEDSMKIRLFLAEFGAYMKGITFIQKNELIEVVKGFIAGEYTTYEAYITGKRAEDEKMDVESYLNDEINSIPDEEENVDGIENENKKVVSDINIHVKKVLKILQESSTTVKYLKAADKEKVKVFFPKQEDLDTVLKQAEDFIAIIEELKTTY